MSSVVERVRQYTNESIDHLDFDISCERCTRGKGEFVTRWVGCSAYVGKRWMFCQSCSTLAGPCNHCGLPGHYEAIS